MGRIAGTGPEQKRRPPRVRIPGSTGEILLVMAVLSPVVLEAPDGFLRAIALVFVIGLAWIVGRATGRADLARELLRRETELVRELNRRETERVDGRHDPAA